MIKNVVEVWASIYANHAAIRTGVEFLHIAGLVAGGGYAIAADRSTLAAVKAGEPARAAQLEAIRSAHRTVIAGLAVLFATGLLLFAADVDTLLPSKTFWLKMGLVALLLANGAMMRTAQQRAERGDSRAWSRLRPAAVLSLALWFLTALAGAALPNLG